MDGYVVQLHASNCLFPGGVWWGLALIRRSWSALVMSNAVVLLTFFGQIFLPVNGFFLLCAIIFPFTVVVERKHALFRRQPAYYAKLRLHLTLVATASMLTTVAVL
jgi:glucose-6-phosphate-specific signal transduction histidine kinase